MTAELGSLTKRVSEFPLDESAGYESFPWRSRLGLATFSKIKADVKTPKCNGQSVNLMLGIRGFRTVAHISIVPAGTGVKTYGVIVC